MAARRARLQESVATPRSRDVMTAPRVLRLSAGLAGSSPVAAAQPADSASAPSAADTANGMGEEAGTPQPQQAAQPVNDVDGVGGSHDEPSREELVTAARAVAGLRAVTLMALTRSALNDAARAGYQPDGSGSGVDMGMLNGELSLGELRAFEACVERDLPEMSMLGAALDSAIGDIEALTALQDRIRDCELATSATMAEAASVVPEVDSETELVLLTCWLVAQPAPMWRDGSGSAHSLYGRPFTARRVKHATEAITAVRRRAASLAESPS